MRAINRTAICNDWMYEEEFGSGKETSVRIPHNVGDIPLHYADPSCYSRISGYRKSLFIPEEGKGKRHFVVFDGAAHVATVYINGTEVATHNCGYTSFRVEITDYVDYGKENEIRVKLDSTEDTNVPPFGYVIDYLTYGGLYREVWYEERPAAYIEDIFVTTPKSNKVRLEIALSGEAHGMRFEVFENGTDMSVANKEIFFSSEQESEETDSGKFTVEMTLSSSKLWDIDEPNLYRLNAKLINADDSEDEVEEVFGIRHAKWKADGFYLNGRKLMLRGLNRHQNFPYIGYAGTKELQVEDARILKEELSCNAVRTSHYPQSQHFIDACDSMGLLVFTEIPGWQHIGDEAWKDQALENTREMIMQYRNHPSIILWGVRINESVDDDDFYTRTNALAHALDPTRSTSGVRYIEKSHLLEDVYSFNDFSHDGTNPGAKRKKDVMKEKDKALLITEANGHMFPTKSFDNQDKRLSHALRHAEVMSAAYSDGDHAGVFQWCMFDYPTHKDFGSGDRVCYHGVLDAFRNPKLAAAVYKSQGDGTPCLEVGSSMDIGDYAAGQLGEIFAFTNADEVMLYKNDDFVATFDPDFTYGIPHPPVLIDDLIGELLETKEGFDEAKAGIIHDCLISAGKHGMANLPATDKAKLAYVMLRYKMSFDDGVKLFGKYVGNWGGEATRWRFDAVKDGEVVATVTKSPTKDLFIKMDVFGKEIKDGEEITLTEGDTYAMAPVRIRIVEIEYGNTASYAQLPIKIEVGGDLELVGPDTVCAEGGMCGTYIKSNGKAIASGNITCRLIK